MSDAYLNLIKAARSVARSNLFNIPADFVAAIEAAEKEVEPWQWETIEQAEAREQLKPISSMNQLEIHKEIDSILEAGPE